LPPNRLELEITEGVLIENTDGAIRTLNELRGMGTRLVLDDFGTGYSSLSYLQRLPFDKLKVDRSFVQRMETDAGSRAIVKAIIAMSSSLNLEVTAEGVETVEQLQLLCALGCHELQGFLLGRPMPFEEVERFLRDYRPAKPEKVMATPALLV
jgi:EAL domain-containing protein (putative c-di-GMP-specific phosphodiesterase class I)